jgi:hypothetical protein
MLHPPRPFFSRIPHSRKRRLTEQECLPVKLAAGSACRPIGAGMHSLHAQPTQFPARECDFHALVMGC